MARSVNFVWNFVNELSQRSIKERGVFLSAQVGRDYLGLEEKLVTAQRARNKTQVKTIHAKITNRRKDALHKFSCPSPTVAVKSM
ncbi:hypothetical protein TOI97_12940 [Denitrificimonas sp. JX-1]|uniref:Transposase n=1 Tax=Denitrificimonas halotolerans TaxID=3098930 RepID=A0ABU5GU09_9GAMM|nr:hypothetical protein [Denitrificimonas sp. JX-1]MDY7220464.1 hypothetical protein [Denitrificimonas sp. JX-1]